MKYFIDTEFIEGFHKPLFGKRRHFIDLISIGIIREDGKQMHCISNEYNYNDADDWVKKNVILPLYKQTVNGDARNHFTVENFHKHFGYSGKLINIFIQDFIMTEARWEKQYPSGCYVQPPFPKTECDNSPEFYAYYADYDWVVFCSLFGRMIDLPKGFPMHCRDLKQTFDEKQKEWVEKTETERLVYCAERKLFSVEIDLKQLSSYPKQENEHSALDDAKWNFELYKYLQGI